MQEIFSLIAQFPLHRGNSLPTGPVGTTFTASGFSPNTCLAGKMINFIILLFIHCCFSQRQYIAGYSGWDDVMMFDFFIQLDSNA